MAINLDLLNNNTIANISTNFQRVKEALQEAVGRNGTLPNHMGADLDMDGNDILNVKNIDASSITIDGELLPPVGFQGWSPVFNAEEFSGFIIMKLVDYVGGSGTKPTEFIGMYIGTDGYVTDPSDAINFGASEIPDGNKGDIIVSGGGTNWAINVLNASPIREKLNLGRQLNYFDFLRPTFNESQIAQISAGTFEGDQATTWQAFRDALWAQSLAGERPNGFLPQCRIKTSVSPNFAMDYLTLETQGQPQIEAIGNVPGFRIDGEGLGVGGYGVRYLHIGPLTASSLDGAQGHLIRYAHQSEFDKMQSKGANFAGIQVHGCVSSVWRKPSCQPQSEPFIRNPSVGLYVSGTIPSQTSWCLFDMPIFEYMPIGIQFENTFGNTLLSGTGEGCSSVGLVMTGNAVYNKIIGTDFEVNALYDIECYGHDNEFFGVDAMTIAKFSFGAYGNKIFGGHWGHISMDVSTKRNLVTGANVGLITDGSTGADRNRWSENTNNTGGWHDRWISYTPTVTAASGTITTASAYGEYRVRDGDTVDFQMQVSITTNGTGAGAVRVDLPFAPSLGVVFTGAEVGVSTKGVTGIVAGSTTQMSLRLSDGTYPGSNGAAINIQGTYKRL